MRGGRASSSASGSSSLYRPRSFEPAIETAPYLWKRHHLGGTPIDLVSACPCRGTAIDLVGPHACCGTRVIEPASLFSNLCRSNSCRCRSNLCHCRLKPCCCRIRGLLSLSVSLPNGRAVGWFPTLWHCHHHHLRC